MEEKSFNSCINMSCQVPIKEKVGLDSDGKVKGHDCIGYLGKKKIKKSLKMVNRSVL